MTAQTEMVRQMKAFAQSRREAADRLTEQAEAVEAMAPETFAATMARASEFSGPGFVAQMLDAVEAAAHARPGAQWHLNKTMADALAEHQRSA